MSNDCCSIRTRANFPFLAANIVETATGEPPDWLEPSTILEVNGVQVGVIGADVQNTPELVKASATEGLTFLDEAERIHMESEKLREQGIDVQIVVIHNGANVGANAIDGIPATAWAGPIIDIVNQLQDTTIDLVLAGHTHRIANTVVGHIPVAEGVNAGGSYSVAQLMVRDGDVAWVSPATRVAKNLGVASRADVQAIVDQANTDTASLRNQVIGTQAFDILRDPARLKESAMGNMVADAMRGFSTRASRRPSPTRAAFVRTFVGIRRPAGEAVNEITWGEVFAVLPFGNRTVIETHHRSAADGCGAERPPAGVQPDVRRRHRALPAGVRAEDHLHLHGAAAGCRLDADRHRPLEGTRRAGGHAHADPSDRHHPHRHQRLHVHGWRRLHGAGRRH